jgi:predicted amidohydrolase YtcJ
MGLGGASWASQADLVVVGPVVTMAASRPHARGLAVAGGKIVFVGDAASARKLLRSGGRLIALEREQTVIPGLVDAHNHMLDAGLMRQRCPLDMPARPGGACGEAKNKVRALEMIAKYSKEHPDLKWVIGSGWSGDWDWVNRDLGPSAAELDAVVADRPAVFYDDNGHSAWLNSLALKAAGITVCKPDPPRGMIECKDGKEDGPPYALPSGTLREAAMVRVEDVVPKPTQEEWLAGLLEAQTYLHSLGITMLQDANVNPRMVEIYHKAASTGQLTMKVVAAQITDPDKDAKSQAKELAQQRDSYSVGRFSASAAKVFVDGVLESKTAALLAPYLVGTDQSGILNWQPSAVLGELVTQLDRHGMQVHMHAIGDRAVREGLDALAAARSANGPSDNRHHMAHLQLVAPADLPRFRALGVIANVQPFWMFPDKWFEQNAEAVIGPERARQLYPLRSIVRTGARIAAGSDWFVSSPNPFLAIQVGMTRQDPEKPAGAPWIPAERVSRQVLLAAYTLGGAYLNHRESETGSLEVGKAADFVIVDRNPLTVPVREIGGIRVRNTFVDGEEVYAANPATGATSRSRPEEGRPQGEGRARR